MEMFLGTSSAEWLCWYVFCHGTDRHLLVPWVVRIDRVWFFGRYFIDDVCSCLHRFWLRIPVWFCRWILSWKSAHDRNVSRILYWRWPWINITAEGYYKQIKMRCWSDGCLFPAATVAEEGGLFIGDDFEFLSGVADLFKVGEDIIAVLAEVGVFDDIGYSLLVVVDWVKRWLLSFLLQINTNSRRCYLSAFILSFKLGLL